LPCIGWTERDEDNHRRRKDEVSRNSSTPITAAEATWNMETSCFKAREPGQSEPAAAAQRGQASCRTKCRCEIIPLKRCAKSHSLGICVSLIWVSWYPRVLSLGSV